MSLSNSIRDSEKKGLHGKILDQLRYYDELIEQIELFLAKKSDDIVYLEGEGFDDKVCADEEEYFKIEHIFTEVTRSSLFLSCYAFFEHALHKVCKFQETRSSSKLKINDIYGNGIIKYQTYLEKVVDVDFFGNKSEWD